MLWETPQALEGVQVTLWVLGSVGGEGRGHFGLDSLPVPAASPEPALLVTWGRAGDPSARRLAAFVSTGFVETRCAVFDPTAMGVSEQGESGAPRAAQSILSHPVILCSTDTLPSGLVHCAYQISPVRVTEE